MIFLPLPSLFSKTPVWLIATPVCLTGIRRGNQRRVRSLTTQLATQLATRFATPTILPNLCHHLAPRSGRGTGDIVGFTTRPTIAKRPSLPDPTDRQISSHRREVYMICMASSGDPMYMIGYHSQQC